MNGRLQIGTCIGKQPSRIKGNEILQGEFRQFVHNEGLG